MKKNLLNAIQPSSGTRFPALDGLRGLAVLLVVFQHNDFVRPSLGYWSGVGVTLFFVLSGFLLYTSYLNKPEQKTLQYYRRRFFRIYPAFLAFTGAAYMWHLAAKQPPVLTTLWPLAKNLSLLYAPPESIKFYIPATWSLASEMQFYILLPLIVLVCKKRKALLLLLFAAACAVQLAAFIPGSANHHFALYRNWPFLALPFLVGMAAAYTLKQYPAAAPRFALPGFGALVLVFLLFAYPYKSVLLRDTLANQGHLMSLIFNFRGLLVSLTMGAMIIGLASPARGVIFRLFAFPAIRFVGVIGYSVFLSHQFIFTVLSEYYNDALVFGLGFPLVIVLSALSYYYIEAPCMSLRPRPASPQPVPASPSPS